MEYHILLADNQTSEREFYERVLRGQGYHVHSARTPDEARHIIQTTRLHLMIIDRKLTDDSAGDRSGEALAIEMEGPIPRLVFTKWEIENFWEVQPNVRPGHLEFLNKHDELLVILSKIEQMLTEHLKINGALRFRGDTFAQIVTRLDSDLANGRFDFLTGDIEDLFRHLFRTRSQIHIKILNITDQPYVALFVSAHGPANVIEPMIVVCGHRDTMLRAYDNYCNYGIRPTNVFLRKHAFWRSYAAVVFSPTSFSGDLRRTMTLRQFYHMPNADFTAVWARFVETTLQPWYQHQQGVVANGSDALTYHSQSLKLDASTITAAAYWRQAAMICAPPLPQLAYNDRKFVLRGVEGDVVAEIPADVDVQQIVDSLETVVGVVNEQIHPDLILVNQNNKQSWLLDFSNISDQAPLLLPFAKMELDLKYDLLDQLGVDLRGRYQIEYLLTQATSLTTQVVAGNLPPGVSKILACIQDIRQHAASLIRIHTMRAYHTSVLLASLAQLTLYNGQDFYRADEQQVRHAHMLISVALVYQALQPSQPASSGLRINLNRRQAWLDNRPLNFTPSEYELVAYLARTPSNPCSYWSIICDLYQPSLRRELEQLNTSGDIDTEAWKRKQIQGFQTKLHPLLNRIRDELQDPPPSQYLVTIRQYGLVLNVSVED